MGTSEASWFRVLRAGVVATLVFSGMAVCGVAATEGSEFSVETVTSATDAVTPSPSTDDGSTFGAPVGSAASGLATQTRANGLDALNEQADVPLASDPASTLRSLTVPAPKAQFVQDSSQDPDSDASGTEVAAQEAIPAPKFETESHEFEQGSAATESTEIESAEPSEKAQLDADTDRQPFAAVGGITLYGPADSIRLAGFHESANTQSLEMRALDSSLETMVMESRGRGTGPHTAADMAVFPDEMIYSPVTGTVVDARAYKLYCKYDDNVVIIEPDGSTDRRVKVLHISGLLVANGERVVAGQTPIANGPTVLPFSSQIDSYIQESTNTHVHIETVDVNLVDQTSSTVCP